MKGFINRGSLFFAAIGTEQAAVAEGYAFVEGRLLKQFLWRIGPHGMPEERHASLVEGGQSLPQKIGLFCLL